MRRDPDALFALSGRKPVPFAFVLEELAELDPWTRPMFGCTAVYVEEKIVLILRSGKADDDNGVWIATTREHHASLARELPGMRSITVLAGGAETGWQLLAEDEAAFEANVLAVCAMVKRGDPRIGKVPKPKRKPPARKAAKATTPRAPSRRKK